MFGGADNHPTSSTTLAKIRQAISSLKPSAENGSKPLMIEQEKPHSITTRKIGEIGSSSSDSAEETKPGTSLYSLIPSWFFSWKLWLIGIILFGIFWVVRPYIKMFSGLSDSVQSILDTVDLSPAPTPPIMEEEEDRATKEIKDKVEGKKKVKANMDEAPQPDDSASAMQGGAQGGFCLAGEWKGVRSCVKVDKEADCVSGQLYQTEDTCVNPSLRA
jgi:hypothetical protein